MYVDDVNTQRFEVALELLEEGKGLTFDRVNFFLSPAGDLTVEVQSRWWIENVNEVRALADLERAQGVVAHLVQESLRFAELVKGRPRRFRLIYYDGRDTVDLGEFKNGRIAWC